MKGTCWQEAMAGDKAFCRNFAELEPTDESIRAFLDRSSTALSLSPLCSGTPSRTVTGRIPERQSRGLRS